MHISSAEFSPHVTMRFVPVPVLAADREPVAVVEPHRHGEPVVPLPVELPAADRQQHLTLARRADDRDLASFAEAVHVQQHRVDREALAQVDVRAQEPQERSRVAGPGVVTRFPAGMRNDCGEMSQPGLTTGALAARFATESSTLSSTTEWSGRGAVDSRL